MSSSPSLTRASSFLFLVSGFWILASLPAPAIVDTNNNTLSDIWEKQYNNGSLLTNLNPQADPDSDGWTNMQEAAAGTNPFNPNPPNGFIRPNIVHIPATYIPGTNGNPVIFTPEAITLTWPTLAGKQYTLHYSPDLSEGSWQPVEAPYIGNGNDTQYGIPLTQENGSTPDKLFWRVAIADIDTDSDTLTNAEEAELGSRPYSSDGDNDGLSDLAELFTHHTNPNSRDTDGDGVSDPDEVLVNFTNPLTATDTDNDGIPDDWEKWWASQILASGITLSESERSKLLAGNIDPGDTPFGDGTTNAEQFEISKKFTSRSDPNSTHQFQMKERAVWGHLLASEEQVHNQCGVRGLANADVRWMGYPWVSTCPPPGWLTPSAPQIQEELRIRAPYSSLSWKTIGSDDFQISHAEFTSSKPAQDLTYTQFKLIENSFKLIYPETSPNSRTIAVVKISKTYGYPIAGGHPLQKCEIVQFTIPAHRTTSQEIEVKPTLTAGSQTTDYLVPMEVAPEVLAVNSDFDEGRIDPATGYAIPDCDDMPGVDQKTGSGNTQTALNASRAHLDGLFANDEKVTEDMHKGWFGVNPNRLNDDFWAGANVTIRKIDKIDDETGYKESGQVRFYAKWNSGYYGISPYDFQTLQPVNLVSAGVNGNSSSVYGASSTIPDGAEFYMEGVRPGKITLEWRLQKGSVDVKHEQTFLVATQKTKQAWIDEVIYQVKLQASDLGSDIDLNDYDPANGFFLPNSNNYKYIQTVYYYYMQLFQQYPERFYWAGMAKTAGASVYAGMVDMATWKTSVFVSNQDVDKVLIDFMIQGNKDIFTDMAWAHHAYAASGIEALDYVKSEEGVETTNFDAWTLVHEGIQENDITKLGDGNQRILRREQQVVMPPLYDTMKEVWLDPGTRLEQFLATDLAGISYPPKNAAGKINIDEMFSINSRNPVQYQLGPSLRQVVPNGKLSDFDDRWAWIDNTQNGMLQIWLGTSTSVPGFTENERSNINGSDLTEHAKIYSMLPTLGGLRDNQFPPPPW